MFFASALKEQAIPTLLRRIPVKPFRTRNYRRHDTCSQQGHHVKPPAGQVAGVEVQFSTLNQDKSSVPTENDNMHARLMPDPPNPNVAGTNNSGLQDAFTVPDAPNVPSSAKHSSAGGKTDEQPSIGQLTMLHEGVGIPLENNNTGEQSIPYPVDPEDLDSMEDAEVLSTAEETSTRKQRADENTVLNSDSSKRQRKNDLPSAHVDTSCKKTSDDNATSVNRQPAPPTHASIETNIKEKVKTTGACDQHTDASPEQDTTLQDNTHGANQLGDDHLSPCICKYPETEFHRFEEERSRDMFERGQVWALYDGADTFPKLYGCITKVVPEPFLVHLIWLEACPQQEQEKLWLEQEIPISCGTFRVSNRGAQYDTTNVFSHLADATETSTLFQFEILPQVGEVWAVYNWAPDWSPFNACEFALGEVVSCSEAGTKFSFLTRVDGYVAVFKPADGREVLEIPTSENSRFSHRIPCFRLSGEKGGVLHGFYELDPASVPSCFLC